MFSLRPLLSLFVAAASLASAAPAVSPPLISGCSVSKARLTLPPGQTGLATPSGPTSFVSVAVGVQNYTCSDAGAFTSTGAVAELFDISCLVGTPEYDTVQDVFLRVWKSLSPGLPPIVVGGLTQSYGNIPKPIGEHYFIINPITGSGLSPKWDFTSRSTTSGNPNAFVVGARSGGIPAPTGPQDIDWLSLSAVQGSLASQVFRVDTREGQPPASCTPGATASIKYAAKYWLLGGSIH